MTPKDSVAAVIAAYEAPPDTPAGFADVVRAIATDNAPHARRLIRPVLRSLTEFGVWANKTGLGFDVETLTLRNVESFCDERVQEPHPADRTRTVRGYLNNLARSLAANLAIDTDDTGSSERIAAAVAAARDAIDDDLWRRINEYEPYETEIAPDTWTATRPTVIQATLIAEPPNPTEAKAHLSAISKFVAWGHATRRPLRLDELFTAEHIDTFTTDTAATGSRSRLEKRRAVLRRVHTRLGRILDPNAPTRAPGPASVAEMVAAYRPFGVFNTPETRDFVGQVTIDMEPNAEGDVTGYLFVVSRYVAYCVEAECLPLDREAIFHPDVLARWLHYGTRNYEEGTRRDFRWRIERVGRKLTRNAPWPPPKVTIARSSLLDPYLGDDEYRIGADIDAQNNPEARRVGRVTYLLGISMGLRGGEHARFTAQDLVEVDGLWCGSVVSNDVRVRTYPHRYVPIRHEYVDELRELAAAVPNGPLLGGSSYLFQQGRSAERVQNLVRMSKGTPSLSPRRLRSTWLLWHLNNDTPLPALLKAAGMTTAGSLTDLFAFMDPRDEHADRRVVAGLRSAK